MIKVKNESYGERKEQSFDADAFEVSEGYVNLKKGGSVMATFAPGHWASVEKEAAPQIEQPNAV